jgi:predicted enzyme related to lactoylglutathione lyase
MGNPVTFFEVVGRDVEALRSFYREAFDWQMQPFDPIPGYAMVRPGDEGSIVGGVGPAYDSGPGHATFYVGVANLEEALDRVEGLGGRKVMGRWTYRTAPASRCSPIPRATSLVSSRLKTTEPVRLAVCT